MEIPLVLASPRPERLTYGFPVWYRIIMGIILAIVVTALALDRTTPGVVGWIVIAILLLGTFYEDKWVFDSDTRQASHRAGLIFAPRTRTLDFNQIQRLCVVPLVKGTVPGTQDEKIENEAALKGSRADDATVKRHKHKRPFLSLEIECMDGDRYLIDHMHARKMEKMRLIASRIGHHCGIPVEEN